MDSAAVLISRIFELQRAAAPLEPDAEKRRALFEAVGARAEDFLQRLPAARVFETNDGPAAELARHRPAETPAALDEGSRAAGLTITPSPDQRSTLRTGATYPALPCWHGGWHRPPEE